jgi:phosphatidate cytidylyltransferase
MNFQAALHDPSVRFLGGFILGALFVAGLALLLLKYAFGKNVTSVWRIYQGWLIMIPTVLAAVLLGREATITLFSIVALIGFREFARATGLYRDWWMTGAVYVSIGAIFIIAILTDPYNGRHGWFGMFRTLPVYAIALILTIPILRNRTKGQLQLVSLALVGFVYIAWMFGHLTFLANSDRPYAYLLFLIVAVEINDIAAFCFGKAFGRHKLRDQISPNKTWEGSLGALAVSMVFPWIAAPCLPHFGPLQLIITGLIVGIGGQLGDLSISVIKRDINIKDTGALIPGHGGILDRIDSLIFTAPLFLHMVNWFYGLYGVR